MQDHIDIPSITSHANGGMNISPDETASPKSFCNAQRIGREDKEGIAIFGWTMRKSAHSVDDFVDSGPNDEEWWLNHLCIYQTTVLPPLSRDC